jgi:hypothetical protein
MHCASKWGGAGEAGTTAQSAVVATSEGGQRFRNETRRSRIALRSLSTRRSIARRATKTRGGGLKLSASSCPLGSAAVPLSLGFGAWALTAAAVLSETGSRTLFGLDEGIYLTDERMGTDAHIV